MASQIVWFDIPVTDVDRALRFILLCWGRP
ncbi:MAG: VOC family protein [Burkholderiales bacterium]